MSVRGYYWHTMYVTRLFIFQMAIFLKEILDKETKNTDRVIILYWSIIKKGDSSEVLESPWSSNGVSDGT